MKTIASAAVITLALSSLAGLSPASAESDDPCGGKNSNMEMRECYAREQRQINVATDLLANKIAGQFRNEAKDPMAKGDVADTLRKAASAVEQSQKTWKAYRDQHCSAVEYSWTTGSGAGTAYEACMFQLGQARLRELRSDFHLELK